MRNQRGNSSIGPILWIAIVAGSCQLCDVTEKIDETNEHLEKIEVLLERQAHTASTPSMGGSAPNAPDPDR